MSGFVRRKRMAFATASLVATVIAAAADRPHAGSCAPYAQPKRAPESEKFQHDLLRCTKLADASACDDALRAKPDNLQLLIARGDALLHGGRAADAVLAYRRAQKVRPADEGIKTKLADAESQRQGLVSICEATAGAASVDACQAALLHGAADEFVLLKRKGILLQSMNQPDPALDAFIAADVIRQNDPSVALAIVALTDSTGRKDPLALAARKSALSTLGHAATPGLQTPVPTTPRRVAPIKDPARGRDQSPGRVQEGRSTTSYVFGAQGNQLRTLDFTDGTADRCVTAGAMHHGLS